MKEDAIDIGNGHAITLRHFKGELAAVDIHHARPDGGACSPQFISFTDRSWARAFQGRITTWEVVSEVPLTLSPSILCRACGDHGFIRDGKWVPA